MDETRRAGCFMSVSSQLWYIPAKLPGPGQCGIWHAAICHGSMAYVYSGGLTSWLTGYAGSMATRTTSNLSQGGEDRGPAERGEHSDASSGGLEACTKAGYASIVLFFDGCSGQEGAEAGWMRGPGLIGAIDCGDGESIGCETTKTTGRARQGGIEAGVQVKEEVVGHVLFWSLLFIPTRGRSRCSKGEKSGARQCATQPRRKRAAPLKGSRRSHEGEGLSSVAFTES
ncbi:uncharacterized protein EI97DRAFT_318159 [Westerdykella ornata]|uniref:Uncharacterized protein n=1 Tax=Westerdykella ornata TaxID=318751 RepID=A0A6A6JP11_WESOR|nr:uncharacterized protein EI97DRAFT_318159 [Westerdykella ornata]KAF2276679.1 hypothetical protein EI97DRAFT_318159 [Westerdykella ornata]